MTDERLRIIRQFFDDESERPVLQDIGYELLAEIDRLRPAPKHDGPKCCGECRWWTKHNKHWGKCGVPLPMCVADDPMPMTKTEGTDCPCFGARETT